MNDADNPLNSSDPDVVEAERQKLIAFMQEEARKDKEEMKSKSDRALREQRSPVPFGGIGAGGLMDT